MALERGGGNLLEMELDLDRDEVRSKRRVWYANGFEVEVGREVELELEEVDETEFERSIAVVKSLTSLY